MNATDLLVAVALRQEAAHLPPEGVVLVGAGKVSAATATARALAERRPGRVLNIGTAGALRPGLVGVHRVGRVLEHDFDAETIERLTGDPVPGELVLDPTSTITLATGDVFVQDESVRDRLARRADLVDMEGYAVARACAAFGVPCTVVKIVSDEAAGDAARTWAETVDDLARRIAEVVEAERGRPG